MSMIENKLPKRIYTIEFLRIFFVFFIILGHIMQMYPNIKSSIYSFVDSTLMPTWFCVKYYSLIAGFLLYKKAILTDNHVFENIVHIYIRLFPTLLFFFILGYIFELTKIENLPYIISMTQGMSLGVADVIGWGDWFLGAYFWAVVLSFSLLVYFKNKAFFFMIPIIYISLCLRYNHPYEGWMKSYGYFIGNEFSRVLTCVMLGNLGGFISEKLKQPNNKYILFLCTILEMYCFFWCFYHIFTDKMSVLPTLISMLLLLILSSKSLGIVSQFFNSKNYIYYLSKYSFNVFLAAAFMQTIVQQKFFYLDGKVASLIIILGGILLGIAEYHLIEQKLVPYLKKYFKENIS